jgi:hypothetical protein
MARKKCIYCPRPLAPGSDLAACTRCRAALHRQSKRGAAWRLNYSETLKLRLSWAADFEDDDVVQLRTKRAREQYAEQDGVIHISTKIVRIVDKKATVTRVARGEQRTQA